MRTSGLSLAPVSRCSSSRPAQGLAVLLPYHTVSGGLSKQTGHGIQIRGIQIRLESGHIERAYYQDP
jgi:hypothetical protein